MKNAALVVIDLQNDITKNYKEIIGTTNQAIDWAVANNMDVVYIQHNNLSAGTRTFDYDTVFVGFPIWWYVAPTIINTFLESYDLTGKTIIPFATSGGSGMGETNEHLASSCKGAKLIEGKVFNHSTSHKELVAWVDGLRI